MRFLKPMDIEGVKDSAKNHTLIVTLEDNVICGGAGEEINNILKNDDVSVINIGWPDKFIEHGSCEELYEKYNMNAEALAERILRELER